MIYSNSSLKDDPNPPGSPKVGPGGRRAVPSVPFFAAAALDGLRGQAAECWSPERGRGVIQAAKMGI